MKKMFTLALLFGLTASFVGCEQPKKPAAAPAPPAAGEEPKMEGEEPKMEGDAAAPSTEAEPAAEGESK